MPSRQDKIIRNYYEHKDTIMANKLAEIVSDLYLAGAASKAEKLWERAAAALMNSNVDPARMSDVLKRRDLEGLAKLAGELSGAAPKAGAAKTQAPAQPAPKGPAPSQAPSNPDNAAGASSSATIPPEELKRAMGAFKKRLKLARLDADSGLTRSPLTGGRSTIVAIQPPGQFPKSVWEELVRLGRLERAGGGLYQLPRAKP